MKRTLSGCLLLVVSGTGALRAADPFVEAARAEIPEVRLDRLVYDSGNLATVTVKFRNAAQVGKAFGAIVFSSEVTGDVEVVPLVATGNPLVYVGNAGMELSLSGPPVQGNGKFELAPGETFSAMVSYRFSDQSEFSGEDVLAVDWGIMADANAPGGEVTVNGAAILTDDELNPPAGSRPFGTLYVAGEPGPVQVASNELLYLPESEEEFQEFVARTGAVVLGYQGSMESNPQQIPAAGTAWLRMQVTGDAAKIGQLPALRRLFDSNAKLSASNQATMALVATATELWCEGFAVGLNPRLQLHGQLYSPEGVLINRNEAGMVTSTDRIDAYGNIGDRNPRNIFDPVYGIRESWAKIAMFDYDENPVPVGVIDSGFAPNPDFKTGHPFYAERNLSNGTSGIGSAQTPQEVGNSGFGDKKWHGNATVTVISGVPGNYFGHAGVGGQTAVPKLYHMGLASFAMGFGTAIDLAVNDGCSVINISAGYPCRILSVLGNDNICSPGDRAIFMAKLGLAVRAAAAAACAAGGLLDAFLPGLGTAVCVSAVVAAETASLAFFATTFLGDTRGPIETAVARATSLGVPIVASAGNDLGGGSVPEPLASLVDLGNTNIDSWQIVPAVIPDVIAVGASDYTNNSELQADLYNHRANVQFWGDSVDIWAPERSWYWAPEDGEADPATVPVTSHIRRDFGGTSNAAPYVTGVIANVLAIDPSLDRRFAPAGEWPNLVGRILDHLLNTAYLAGSPELPDSADDVVTFERDETDTLVEVDEPPELLAQMERRRNMVNPGAAVDLALANVGLPDFGALGFDMDLGDTDDFADSAPPSDVREPLLPATPFTAVDEINERDAEFWYVRIPPTGSLYRHDIQVTIPLMESRTNFLMNGTPGTLVSTAAPEQTVAWEMPARWATGEARFVPLRISGTGTRADSLYKLTVTRTQLPPPAADSYDIGSLSNEDLDDAPAISSWVSVPPRGSLEVGAFEICLEDLTFHEPEDVDVFRIDFPNPPLDVPFSCSSLNPWVTFRIEPPSGVMRMEVFSRAGGTDTLLARGGGSDVVRLDCRDYLGRLPLYVKVSSPSQAAIPNYDLKVRWSEPSEDLDNRLTNIREAWAARQLPPFFEQFFPPEIPWLRTSPGPMPPEVVNPNPAFEQALGANGEFMASRLFFFEVPVGAFDIGFATLTPISQSLRLEIVHPSGAVYASTGTPDLGFGQNQPELFGETRVLRLHINGFNAGVYLLRMSGHSPGDEIAMYLSADLVPPNGVSINSLEGQGQGIPVVLPSLEGFDGLNRESFASSALFPEFSPHRLILREAQEIRFPVDAGVGYQVEVKGEDGIWAAYGPQIVVEEAEESSLVLPLRDLNEPEARIVKLGDGGTFEPTLRLPAKWLSYQSVLGVPFTLYGTADLEVYTDFTDPVTGDGTVQEWLAPLDEVPPAPYFFQVRSP